MFCFNLITDDLPKEEESAAPKQPKPIGGKPVGGVGFGNIFAGGSVHLRKTNQDQNKGPKKSELPKRPAELSNLQQKRVRVCVYLFNSSTEPILFFYDK